VLIIILRLLEVIPVLLFNSFVIFVSKRGEIIARHVAARELNNNIITHHIALFPRNLKDLCITP
jgi:hypothetical protein